LRTDEILGALKNTDGVHEVTGTELVGVLPLIVVFVAFRQQGVVVLAVLPDGGSDVA